jgi:hypothetical protein
MNAMERVWTRMKTKGTYFAKRKAIISAPEAEKVVITICRVEGAAHPPPDALEYLTEELMRLSLHGRNG